tara:strand:- start:113 stop:391 length:279 start_codon:yes stop_codon:yes gene_type:complete
MQSEALSGGGHGLEPLLIIGPPASHKDANLMLEDLLAEDAHRADDPIERGGHVCKVGDTAADDQALWATAPTRHQVEDRASVLKRERLGGRA